MVFFVYKFILLLKENTKDYHGILGILLWAELSILVSLVFKKNNKNFLVSL
jgi:hypothetical protein